VSNNNKGDRFWLNERDSNWLVSLKNSERIPLQIKDRVPFWFSPDGTFLVYYDLDKHHYFSYDLLLRKLTNITSALEPGILDRKYEYIHPYNNSAADLVKTCVGIADWLMEAKKMLVYDDYDVWLLDLTGRQSPVNLTNGYGREHNIKFRLFSKLGLDKRPLLTAFNTLNKENGFFRMSLDGKADPELLVMEAKTYFHSPIEVMNPEELDNGMRPLKARKADKWLVKKQSAEEAPNFFVTSDFKNYKPLTFIFPEKNYSWVKSKLINWKLSDHEQTQGILYVPENFDSTKKYPVIFQIYEQYSHRLFEYPTPGFSTDFVNIPWCVSKGYLIFMPDIHFNIGEIGRSALTTVVTAVKALSDLPFVDTSRLALMGHSYSGQMVYHIITHTNFFAAAVASAGVSDQVSGSLQLTGYGLEKKDSRLQNAEIRLGASLWERPDLYLAETPVLHAHKVTTPIVILHSITDGLPWEQAVEMFISLRRNGKRAWMLQYENSGHSLAGKDAVDYTYRIFQFFDHYLSSAPAPRWMTSGIRASRKGVDLGLEFDPTGLCGKDCSICKAKKNSEKNEEVPRKIMQE
jgi:hypothetical protein